MMHTHDEKSPEERASGAPHDFWAREARRILKSLLAREGVTYKGLALRLERLGLEENPRQLCNKINRGTFSFEFFIKCLSALGHTEAQFQLKAPSTRQR